MVDPRIYRACLVLVAFAVIVFAFSLQNAPAGLTTSIAPGQFFSGAPALTKRLARAYPRRAPGSKDDVGLAGAVQSQLQHSGGFTVDTDYFSARTAQGARELENVIATRPGLESGQVVVVSDRDAPSLGGTAAMLELAGALSGETLGRAVTLVSTTGEVGAAGTSELAGELSSEPVDAVIVLGDLTSLRARQPVVVPWSSTDRLAPLVLRETLSHYVRTAAGIPTANPDLGGQFLRLAFPFSITDQAPLARGGIAAVLLSLSGDRLPTAASQPSDVALPARSAAQLSALGTAVLQSVNALDAGGSVAAPSSYLVLSGKVVPSWAVRLLVLILILPVAATTVDALARTRRRGHALLRWVVWVLTGVVPFLAGLAGLFLARATGLLRATPPGAVGANSIAAGSSGVAALIGVALLVLLAFVFLRPLCLRVAYSMMSGGRRPQTPAADAAAVALSLVMCLTTLVIWLLNPFAAALLVPALHLWIWLAAPGVRSRRWAVLLLALVAVLPAVAVIVYYAELLGLGPGALVWSGALMIAGGAMPLIAALYWCVTLGCLASVLVIGFRSIRATSATAEQPVTVRGPSSYAGPGSLGGTESALRR